MNFFALLSSNLLRFPVVLLINVALAQLAGAKAVGIWAIFLALNSFFASFFFSWSQSSLIRFGTEEYLKSNCLKVEWYSRLPVILLTLVVASLLLFFPIDGFPYGLFSIDSSWALTIFLFLLAKFFSSEAQTIFRVVNKVYSFSLVNVFAEVLMLIFLGYVILFNVTYQLDELFFRLSIITLISSVLFFSYAFRNVEHKQRKFSVEHLKAQLKYSWPIIPSLGLSFFISWTPILLLNHFSSLSSVGIFNVGNQILVGMSAFAAPLSILILPKVLNASIHSRHDQDVSSFVFFNFPGIIAIWLIFLCAVYPFIPILFNWIFAGQFEEGTRAMAILLGILPGTVLTALYGTLYEVQRRMGTSAFINLLMISIHLILGILLVRDYDYEGVAISLLVSYLVTQAIYVFDQHRLLKISYHRLIILFTFGVIVIVINLAFVDNFLFRFFGFYGLLIGLVLTCRHYQLISSEVIDKLMIGPLGSLRMLAKKLLCR